jgi:signal transduction histidine kinase/ligand-binding sensor domain-containing protein
MKPFCLRTMLLVVVAWVLAGGAQAASASSRPWSLNHYQHTAFTKKDGAPQAVMQLAETSDGYLWATDDKGLSRFDGHRFQSFIPYPGEKLLGKQVQRIFAPNTGGLWVSYDVPGISFINHGHISNYENNAGWSNRTAEFLQDRQGNILAYAFPGLMKFVDGKWKRVDEEPSPPDIAAISQDEYFNIWAATRGGRVLVLREGESHFKDTGIDFKGAISVSTGSEHNVFVAMRDHVIRRFIDRGDKFDEVGIPIPYYARRMLVDRRGNVWVGTANDGVHFLGALSNLPTGDTPFSVDEKLNRSGGLTGNFANVFEDSKGNIWTGTESGLDRFTPSSFSQLTLPTGITMVSIAPGKDGDVWIGSDNFNVLHYDQAKTTQTDIPKMALATHTATTDGSVFAATVDELWQLAPGNPVMLAKLPVQGGGVVKAITLNNSGKLWLSYRGRDMKMATLDDGKWVPFNDIGSPVSLHTDPSGVIWAGFDKNRLVSINREEIKQYSERDGLSAGITKVIVARNGQLWLGGDSHLQMFGNGTFSTLKLAGVHELEDISGLVFDKENNLWVHTLEGLFKIDSRDVRRATSDHNFAMPYRLFDSEDGVPGLPAQTYTLPTLTLGSDGRLWITGQTAAAWIDPEELLQEPRLSLPIIEQVSNGNEDYDLTGGSLRLPKDARNLQISYTTPELTFPSRVRFQYRLKGFDSTWQEAGSDRKASYTHLSAGDYTFEVRSTYGGHAWSNAPSSVSFAIAPKYFETWWFRMAVAALALAVLWAMVRLQVRMATSRERNRMRIRLDEREVIARDLHDTLLQSTQALVLQLDSLAASMTDPTLKKKLDLLTKMSEDAFVEGCGKVQALRLHSSVSGDQVTRLVQFGMGLSSQYGIRFKAQVEGSPRPLNQMARDELVPIVSELLINAFRHSKATVITTNLTFGLWRFLITVSDDGVGIDERVLTMGAPEGHWGIKGIKERAARIGGRVMFQRLKPCGTKIVVIVPSRRVYATFKKSQLE